MNIIYQDRHIKDENYLQKRNELNLFYNQKISESKKYKKIICCLKKCFALWQLTLDDEVYKNY
jgi:hypothetical protein